MCYVIGSGRAQKVQIAAVPSVTVAPPGQVLTAASGRDGGKEDDREDPVRL
jgi:hypothetical protein